MSVSSATSDREIVITRVINAPREMVLHVWIDPVHIGEWWWPDGFTLTIHEMNVRPGGVWRYIMHGPDGVDYKNKVVYVEIAQPERLIYDHGGENDEDPGHCRTTVTFADEGKRTRLTMRALVASAEECEVVKKEHGAVEGGNQTLARLEAFMERTQHASS